MKKGSSGGIATGIKRRKIAIQTYYENPKYCQECNRLLIIGKNDRVGDIRVRKYCRDECENKMRSSHLKKRILKLFNKGMISKEISEKLKCSKSTVSYYCSELIPKDERYSIDNIRKYQRYYDTYKNLKKTATFFDLLVPTLRSKLKLDPKINKTYNRNKTDEEKNQAQINGKKKNVKSVVEWRRRNKLQAIEYKGGKCQNCTYKRSVYSLAFHHTNPKEKDFSISGKSKKWETMKKELDKCVLVCQNCHGEIHEELNEKGFSKIVKKIWERSSREEHLSVKQGVGIS